MMNTIMAQLKLTIKIKGKMPKHGHPLLEDKYD